MHRGGVPFVSPEIFQNIYWATVKPIIEELWADGHQTLFYAEGKWDHHLESFAELPERSIVYHVDQGDIFKAHRVLGEKFCLSGGVSERAVGAAARRTTCANTARRCIDGVARDGGYIMDASAIVQNDAKVENIRAMTDFTREYGVYSQGRSEELPVYRASNGRPAGNARLHPATDQVRRAPGVCQPWREKRATMPAAIDNEPLCQRVWEDIDALANMYVWQILLSF